MEETKQEEKDYVFPEPTPDQLRRLKRGGEAVTRVVKHTYADPYCRFDIVERDGKMVKQVRIGQFRVPLAGRNFDLERLQMEMRREGLVLLEEVFPEAGHYCEVNDCWNKTKFLGNDPTGKPVYEAFCSERCKRAALTAHDRMVVFE